MFTSFASIPSTRLVGSRTTLFICLLIAATRSVNGCNICESSQNFLSNPDDTLTDIPEEFNLGSEATCSAIYEAGLKDYSGDCTDLRDFIYGKCRCNGIYYDPPDDKKEDVAVTDDKKEDVAVTDDKKDDEAAKDDKKDDEAAEDDKKDDEAVTDDKKEGEVVDSETKTNETNADTTSMTTTNSISRTTSSMGITAIVLSTIFSVLLGLLM